MHNDPNWPRAGEHLSAGSGGLIEIIGVPLANSISPGRTDKAPAAIREALKFWSLYEPNHRIDLSQYRISDLGDCEARELKSRLSGENKKIILGGDNGITNYGVLAMDVPLEKIGVITLDAHHDVRHLENGLHNGNPIRALIEQGLPGRNLIQAGILPFANSGDYARYCEETEIRIVPRRDVPPYSFQSIVDFLAHRCEVI